MPFTPFLFKLTGRSGQLFPSHPKKKEQPLSAGGGTWPGLQLGAWAGPGAGTGTLGRLGSRWLGRTKLRRWERRAGSSSARLFAGPHLHPFPRLSQQGGDEKRVVCSVSAPACCCPAQGKPSPVSDPRVRVENEPERLFPAVTPRTSSCPPTGEGWFGGLLPTPDSGSAAGGGPWQVPAGAPGLSLPEL